MSVAPFSLWTCLIIVLWYCISNAIILTTKWLFSTCFPYPLTVTAYSNGVAAIWAAILSFGTSLDANRQPLSRKLALNYVLPIGVMTALEIGCSNLALKILTVSFGTIVKGVSPIFTFAWGLAFGVEHFSWKIGISLLLISIGIALASLGEGREFQLFGFILQLSGSALGGLRWAMTHKLLKRGVVPNSNDDESNDVNADNVNNNTGEATASSNPKMSPLTAALYTSPVTSLCIIPFALALEGASIRESSESDGTGNSTPLLLSPNSTETERLLDDDKYGIFVIIPTMTFIATLVFLLLMSEYWLVKATSSLALSVAGVMKELITIGGGIFLFREVIDLLNVVGFMTCQVGIISYVCLRTSHEGSAACTTTEGAAGESQLGVANVTFSAAPCRDDESTKEASQESMIGADGSFNILEETIQSNHGN